MEIRPNDIVGRVGKAWVISGEGWPATVAGYYIHRPAGLPWTWWQIAVVHLREVEGAPPAKIFLPGATHEFVFASLDTFANGRDPEAKPPNPVKPGAQILTPPDYVGQFAGLTDEQAAKVLKIVAMAICSGVAPVPDGLTRTWWANALQNTVSHTLNGFCAPGGRA